METASVGVHTRASGWELTH